MTPSIPRSCSYLGNTLLVKCNISRLPIFIRFRQIMGAKSKNQAARIPFPSSMFSLGIVANPEAVSCANHPCLSYEGATAMNPLDDVCMCMMIVIKESLGDPPELLWHPKKGGQQPFELCKKMHFWCWVSSLIMTMTSEDSFALLRSFIWHKWTNGPTCP